MNVALLKDIQREILKEPTHFYIDDWVEEHTRDSTCGTTACIAGWAVVKDFMQQNPGMSFKRACESALDNVCGGFETCGEKLLGITSEQAQRLFFSDWWPQPYNRQHLGLREELDKAGTTACKRAVRIKMARVAVRRISHFIKTKGVE